MEYTLNITKALADGNRMRVVAALMAHDELCVCQITEMLQLTTPTVSRHMSIMQNARLVENRKEGRWVFYRLLRPFPDLLYSWLSQSFAASPEIQEDKKSLVRILACDPEDLCRRQKSRRSCHK